MLQLLIDRKVIVKGRINPHFRKYLTNVLIDRIICYTDFLPAQSDIKQHIHCILHDIESNPVCDTCGIELQYTSKGYKQYCSNACIAKSQSVKSAKSQTNIIRYGTDNAMKCDLIKDKQQQTNLERYGHISPLGNEQIRSKASMGFKDTDTQRKAHHANIIKYGTACPANTSYNKLLRKQALQLTHGVDNISQIGIKTSVDLLKDRDWLITHHHDMKMPLCVIAELLSVDQCTVQNYIHQHDITVKRYFVSKGQQQIQDWLTSIGIHYTFNDRTLIAGEIDIVIPEYKIAIEYNGLYWHSEQCGKDRSYHITKSNLCAQQGYQLIHIFDDEWLNQSEIVKSRLIAKMGLLPTKIAARKCRIARVDNVLAKKFMVANHIQGYGPAAGAINVMLFDEDDNAVAAMCIATSRYSGHQYELIRFCNKLNCNVVGGLSKLLKWFIRQYNPTSIISYSNKRWNTGNGYTQVGFVHTGTSVCGFSYFNASKGNKRISRQTLQKKHLHKKLEDYNPELSTTVNLINHGYHRIWDCGNDIFVYTI